MVHDHPWQALYSLIFASTDWEFVNCQKCYKTQPPNANSIETHIRDNSSYMCWVSFTLCIISILPTRDAAHEVMILENLAPLTHPD